LAAFTGQIVQLLDRRTSQNTYPSQALSYSVGYLDWQ